MRFYNTNFETDEKDNITNCTIQLFENKGELRLLRSVDLIIGMEYIVKYKQKERMCIIKNFIKDKIGNPLDAKVKFIDTNKSGIVELKHFIPQ